MLGLIGKGEAVLDSVNAGGELSDGFRYFHIPATRFGNSTFMIAELDYSNEGQPVEYIPFNSNTPLIFPGIFREVITSIDSLPQVPTIGGYINGGRVIRNNVYNIFPSTTKALRFRYASPIAPVTRNFRARITNPSGIVLLSFASEANAGFFLAVPNSQWNGDLKNQLAQFPNCKALYFGRQGVSRIDDWPASLEMIFFRNCSYLDIIVPFPKTVKHISWGVGDGRAANYFNDAMQHLTDLEDLYFAFDSGYPGIFGFLSTGITGVLDLTGKNKLKVFTMVECPGVTIILPSVLNDIEVFDQRNTGLTVDHIPSFEDILHSPGLLSFFLVNQSALTWEKDFTDSDVGANLRWFGLVNIGLNGNITFTNPHPGITHFWTGSENRSNNNRNELANVDISGINGAVHLDLTGCKIEQLVLPVAASLQILFLSGNKLSVSASPNLVSQIRSCISIVNLRLGIGSQDIAIGQDSIDGFGNDLNLDSLVNMNTCAISQTKLTGIVTLPNVAKLTVLECEDNAITGFSNLSAHGTTLINLFLDRCPNLAVPGLSALLKVQSFRCRFSGLPVIDLSGRTDQNVINFLLCNDNTNLTTVILPTALGAAKIGTDFHFYNSPNLSIMSNLSNLEFSGTATFQRTFHVYNCILLNITFPLGSNNFLPGSILIHNNGMDQANVDATINSLYQNRSKNWGAGAKTLNISGNSAPSGAYQAPTGFIQGSADGSSISAKEQVYVLVNNYGWTVSMN
jgi:hypothetical protein